MYIVTDRQCPHWLNTAYEKVSIIDHSLIMPQEIIPCFNSNVIEYFLPKIPALSERFLYANDDFFLGRTVRSSDFFEDGMPIVRVKVMNKYKTLKKQRKFFLNMLLLIKPYSMLPKYCLRNMEKMKMIYFMFLIII